MIDYYLHRLLQRYWLFKAKRKSSSFQHALQLTKQSPFYIVSAGRSGSTLLRRLLTAGSEVHIPPESDDFQLKVLFGHLKKSNQSWLIQSNEIADLYSQSGLHKYWALDLEEYRQFVLETPIHQQNLYFKIWSLHLFHAKTNGSEKIRIADKTPLLVEWVDWLNTVSPNSPYIFLIRDVRDVVASRMRHFKESLEQAFKRYSNAHKAIRKFEKKHPKLVLRVRYENLVYNTKDELKRICEHTGLIYNENMLKSSENIIGDGHLEHHADVHKPISDLGIGKWKEQLTKEQLVKINAWSNSKIQNEPMLFFNRENG